ncbi:MAG TPA: NAD(P)/FAD-dependent oxidoreductase [Myxococcota bacterium]|nr:NAD(P)/FAD-dependent oxidoreductase [Myxococcota bacterium]
MPDPNCCVDALIVGAGPAGLATGIALARRGRSALVIERRSGPLDKACGEGIMPPGVRALAALGVDVAALRAAPFAGVRFVEGARAFEGRFATGTGLGVRRTALSEALLGAARRAGVETRFACELTSWEERGGAVLAATSQGPVCARVLVGADGLASEVRARAGLARAGAAYRRRRFGVRRHFRIAPWSEWVEVHWGDGVEAYVTPVAHDEVAVALLWQGDGGSYPALLAHFPALAARLADAEPISEARGAGPFWQRARGRVAGRVALVGDAAGYTDAVTGEGITLALRSADALAGVIATGAPLATYEPAWRRLSRAHRAFAALLGFGVAHPRARRAAFAALAGAPNAFQALLRRAAGETAEPWPPSSGTPPRAESAHPESAA